MWRETGKHILDYLRECHLKALADLDGVDPDRLLSENEDVLVAALLQKHMPDPIAIEWAAVESSSISEVTMQLADQFGRDRLYTVPASKITLRFPFTGSKALLDYPASTFSMSDYKVWSIQHGNIVLEVTERELTAETIQSRISALKQALGQQVEWANADLTGFLPQAEDEIRRRIDSRKQRILNDRKVQQALGIPLISTGVRRQKVPAQRKQLSLEQRGNNAKFVPEPVLEEADYRDVLEQVHGWALQMERVPGTAAKLDEEELRDLLLGSLNTVWQGAAGGELFNGAGKTDILVRHADRNVFIGELKFWRGPKTVVYTINQLLSYLVWRDSKAAVVMFIKTADPTATIEKLHREVASHPSHLLTRSGGTPSKQVDYVFTADDEGRRISLAVIPVVLTPADQQ